MRQLNSAVERADAAQTVPTGFDGRVPHFPTQCSACQRFVDRERQCVVAIGAEELCGLCQAVFSVQNAIPTSTPTADEESAAIAALRVAYDLIRQRGAQR